MLIKPRINRRPTTLSRMLCLDGELEVENRRVGRRGSRAQRRKVNDRVIMYVIMNVSVEQGVIFSTNSIDFYIPTLVLTVLLIRLLPTIIYSTYLREREREREREM